MECDDENDEGEFCTWNIAFIVALVIFLVFMLLHTRSVTEWLVCEIPDNTWRIITIGLIIAGIAFLFIGMMLHTFRPITRCYRKRKRG